MEQVNDQDVEIDLKEIFAILLDRAWIIIFIGIFTAIIAGVYTKVFITPMYTSTTKLYVINRQNEENAVTYSDLQTGSILTKDYTIIVTGTRVMSEVISELNLNMSTSQLCSSVSVSNPSDSRFIVISVQNEDPVVAQQIAKCVAEVSVDVVVEVMDIKKVNIAEEASLPTYPTSPNLKKNVLIGGAAGAFVAVAIIVIIFLLDDSIRSAEDVRKYLGLNTLGQIPVIEGADSKKKKKNKKNKKKKIHAEEVTDEEEEVPPVQVNYVKPAQVNQATETVSAIADDDEEDDEELPPVKMIYEEEDDEDSVKLEKAVEKKTEKVEKKLKNNKKNKNY